MLRLVGGQVESLFDELLPVEVRELPTELAALDRLLADRGCWPPSPRPGSGTAPAHRREGRGRDPVQASLRGHRRASSSSVWPHILEGV
jgi:hypothetical protein